LTSKFVCAKIRVQNNKASSNKTLSIHFFALAKQKFCDAELFCLPFHNTIITYIVYVFNTFYKNI